MGLAGASTKRKITDDPRNTRWRNDTSAPGFKMLTAMCVSRSRALPSASQLAHRGWTPESAALNPTTSAPAGRRALTSIPSAKDDTLGIGATPTTSASSVFAAFGSRAGLRFVTAGASDEVRRHRKTEGGEFASLLDRLNTSASASPAPEAPTASGEERPRKKTKRWRAEEDEVAVEEPVVIAAPLPIPLPARVRCARLQGPLMHLALSSAQLSRSPPSRKAHGHFFAR
jgi:hypothetical protein